MVIVCRRCIMAAVVEALGWNANWSEKVRMGVDVEVKGTCIQ